MDTVNSSFYNSGYIYLVGAYGGHLYFPNDTLICNGWNDIFIAKLNSSGNIVWSRTIGSTGMQPNLLEEGFGSLDTVNQCLYVSGKIHGTVDFGNGVSLVTSPSGGEDAFLAKYNLNGDCQWAKLVYSAGKDIAYCHVQPDGNVLLTGKLENIGYVDTIPIIAGGFIARFDSYGNVLWAQNKFMGPEKYPIHIGFIGSDIIMSGVYDTITAIIDTCQLQLTGTRNSFLTRLDSIGGVIWINSFEGGGANDIGNIIIDDFSNIIVTGGFQYSIKLGSVTLFDNNVDMYIAKFSSNGNTIYTKQINCDGNYAAGTGLSLDINGNYYVTGFFSSNASFGTLNISTVNQYDMFIAKYSVIGDCVGVVNFGQAVGQNVVIDNLNNAICAGGFVSTVNIGGTSMTALNNQDIFLAKLDEISGISEQRTIENKLHVYANPSNGSCTVNIPDVFTDEYVLQITVMNSEGKIVLNEQIEVQNNHHELNLISQPKGLYNVYLTDGKLKYSGKIVFN